MIERPWSIALRLTAWYAVTAFVLVAAATLVQYRALAADLASEDDQLILETLAAVQRGVPLAARDRAVGVTSPVDASLVPVLRVLDTTCAPIWSVSYHGGPPPECKAPARPASAGAPRMRTWHAPDGEVWRVALQPLSGAARQALGTPSGTWLEVVLDRRTDVMVLRHYRQELSAVLSAALLLSAAIGYALARRGLRPLDTLGDAVARVNVRSLDEPIRLGQLPAEVDALARSFDSMRGRLNDAFAALTQFSSELAHDLRTPIHVLRQQAEVALSHARTPDEYRDVLGSSLEELERLQRMVDDTLFLARAEDPRARINCASLDVAEELAASAEFLDAVAQERAIAVTTSVPPGLVLWADRTLLRRALVNLLTNAIRHSNAGSTICSSAGSNGDTVSITVQDSGEGIAPELLPRVFDRYVRAERSIGGARGAGLGLAIVRGIMSLHGGSVHIESVAGRGTTAILHFPAQRTPVASHAGDQSGCAPSVPSA